MSSVRVCETNASMRQSLRTAVSPIRVRCLTARQELSRQRVGLAGPDNSDTQNSNGGRGRRGQRRRSYKLTSAASVEDREPAELQATQWRLRWRTGDVAQRRRWRTGAGTVAAPMEDWRRRAAAPVEDRSLQTSREPAAGVMDRRRSGQRSDSESRSLRTAGLRQPAGPCHSPAPTEVRRGTSDHHGWIGSKAVEITGSRVGQAAIQV
jgi:hypothetical protein